MFTKAQFEATEIIAGNTNDIFELDIETLSIVGGGDGTSIPYIGGK